MTERGGILRSGVWWRWYLGAGLVAAALVSLLPSGGRGHALLFPFTHLALVGAMVLGVRINRPTRPGPWYLLTVAIASSLVGDALRSANETGMLRAWTSSSVANVFYVVTYVVALAALVGFTRARGGWGDRGAIIDALIFTAGPGALIWALFLDAHGTVGPVPALATAYPAGDLLLLAVVVHLAFVPGARSPAFSLLMLFFAAQITGDVADGHAVIYGTSSLADPVWTAAFAFLGAVTLHPSMRHLAGPAAGKHAPGARWRLPLLAGSGLLAGTAALYQAFAGEPRHVVALTVVAVSLFLLALVRVRGLMVSVEEHSRVQGLLEASEAKYRNLVEQIPAFTYVDVPDPSSSYGSRSVFASQQIGAMLGYTAEEFVADPEMWTRLLHPEDRERQFAEDARLWATGEPYTSEYRLIASDGRVVWVRNDAILVRGDSGEPLFNQGVIYDITAGKLAEEEIRGSEARFRSLLAGAPDAVVVIDEAGKIVLSNDETARVFGYGPDELTGTSVEALIPERFRAAHLAHRQVYGASPSTRTMGAGLELFGRRKDGTELPVDISLSWIRPRGGTDGSLTVAFVRDVSERKLAEEALRRRDRILEAVAHISDRFLRGPWESGIGEALAHLGAVAGVSRVYVFRNERDEGGGLRMTQAHEWVAPGIATTIEDPLNAHYPYALGFQRWERELGAGRLIHGVRSAFPEPERADMKDEDILSVAIVPVFVGKEWWGFLGFDDCVAEREWSAVELEALKTVAGILGGALGRTQAEEELAGLNVELETKVIERTAELRAAQAFLTGVIESSPAVTYRGRSDELVLTYVSPNVERILGYRPEEVLGTPGWWPDHIHPDDRQGVWEATRLAVEARATQAETVHRLRAADGTYRWFYNVVLHDYDETGDQVGFLGASLDITDRKRAEDALVEAKQEAERARDDAEQANRAKSEFLSRASHELRTPLNAILGFGQLLEVSSLSAEDAESVEQILKGGRNLLDLVNELLDVSRVQSGALSLSIEPVSVDQVVGETLDLILPLSFERGVELHSEIPHPSPFAMADRQRLQQILLNLLSNAVNYNREGGEVTVSCERSGETVILRVTDTGAGIRAEHIDRLFSAFDRLGAETSDRRGAGLGLVLAKALTETMGGSIGVESEAGVGSTFWVRLAAAEDPLEVGPRANLPEALEGAALSRPRTILYVEDNLTNIALIERILARRPGVRLIAAMQGRLGVELAGQHLPDLVLLDLHLRDVPGEEVLAALRASPETAGIPVVVMSADATEGRIGNLLSAGVRDYLTKPLDVRRFIEVLDGIIGAAVPAGEK